MRYVIRFFTSWVAISTSVFLWHFIMPKSLDWLSRDEVVTLFFVWFIYVFLWFPTVMTYEDIW